MKGEQMSMELDTQLEVIIKEKALAVTDEVREKALTNMIHVRNRHEAYGIAAENLVAVTAALKTVKNDVSTLLETLPDPNRPAVEATSAIRNSAEALVIVSIKMASIMERVLRDLYDAEETDHGDDFPIVSLNQDGFEEAEPTEDNE